jgi:hypothetical protein
MKVINGGRADMAEFTCLWKAEEHDARSWGTTKPSIEGILFRDQ